MRVLFDILHPAHVHFFRNAIGDLLGAGHEVRVVARDKDLTLRLLELYAIPHTVISTEARTKKGLVVELLTRNLKLLGHVARWRPQVMASIGGISTAQVGWLSRTPNLIFYDTENATLQNRLSYPFATAVVTPECYHSPVQGRHETYAGYHELAYLHPRRFTPDPEVLRRWGVDPAEPFSVVRFVSWQAMHDVNARGFSLQEKEALIARLSRHGRVFITSEKPLPPTFEPHRLPLPPHEIHHLLAYARLFAGESATMASEAVILGTPAVYLDVVGRGYTDEQENRYGLVRNFRPEAAEEAMNVSESLVATDRKGQEAFRASVARMLGEKIDVTGFMVERLLRAARERR